MRISRRAMLAGLAAGATFPLHAEAPLTSPRPIVRAFGRQSGEATVARAQMDGMVSFLVADAETGEVLDAVSPDLSRPPASVAKAATAGYALETLGPEHRFVTRLLGTGPIENGVLKGDLILEGGADPLLQTIHLAEMVAALKAQGVSRIDGRVLAADGALKQIFEIDTSQADHLGYNPSISGLNLNFNRVHFEWKLENGDYSVAVDARGGDFTPAVDTTTVRVIDRNEPVYTYRDTGRGDAWTVARGQLNDFGSRWLPVRYPALYAGEVLVELARAAGLSLPEAERSEGVPAEARELTRYTGEPLPEVLQSMLRYSTNITAEIAGLWATKTATGDLAGLRLSGLAMSRWWEARAGVSPYFADHSGLSDLSRVTAREMVEMLRAPGMPDQLFPILKPIAVLDRQGNAVKGKEDAIRAKTGTLNFVSGLAGYVTGSDGRRKVFASFAADLDARAVGEASGEVRPRGSADFNRRAINLHQALLRPYVL